ncbi:MAG: glutaminyl-peptide cyclotransferase [Verrucomicrobiales bacterium]|nr:glutaminyl-peptide cyclotransferase [Verrucomicrobiales bacterium]
MNPSFPLPFLFSVSLLALASCQESNVAPPTPLEAEVVEVLPHDNQAFTQGLLLHDGHFYESTGQYGESTLRKIKPRTGEIVEVRYLTDEFFGEGLALLGDRLFQLTWKAGKGFIYDLKTFKKLDEFAYEGEGWGLTTDGTHLIMSDGTSTLRFLDPKTFQVVRRLEVADPSGKVADLNELEYVNGQIFANLWYRDEIVRISPETGHVTGILSLRGLLRPIPSDPDSVLNGIAYNKEKDLYYVTGKRWPKIFAIRIRESSE